MKASRAAALWLIAIAPVSGILIPVSGAWLFAAPGVLIVLGARKTDGGAA